MKRKYYLSDKFFVEKNSFVTRADSSLDLQKYILKTVNDGLSEYTINTIKTKRILVSSSDILSGSISLVVPTDPYDTIEVISAYCDFSKGSTPYTTTGITNCIIGGSNEACQFEFPLDILSGDGYVYKAIPSTTLPNVIEGGEVDLFFSDGASNVPPTLGNLYGTITISYREFNL